MKPWDQRLAAIVVRPFANSFVTPNMMTGIGLAFGLGAALLFSLGEWSWAGVLFVLAVFWDHTDGELARLTGQTSRFGHYFDHTVAFLNYACAFFGMGIGLAARGAEVMGIAGAIAGVSIAGIFAVRNYGEWKIGRRFMDQPSAFGFEIEDVMYLIGPIAWLGWIKGLVVAAVVGAPLYLFWTVAALRRGRRA